MRSIVTGLALGMFLLWPSVSWALPPDSTGGARCQCTCSTNVENRDLDWAMDKSCGSSNGKSCKIWKNGKWVYGKFDSCLECRGTETQTGWHCKASWVRVPSGTLQPKQQTQPRTTQPATPR